MPDRSILSLRLLRTQCMAVCVLGCVGNVGLAAAYPWIFPALGASMPKDEHALLVDCMLSFTLGLVGLVALRPRNASFASLVVFGKAFYAVSTFVLRPLGAEHPLYDAIVAWDALLSILFFLYWIAAKGDPLFQLRIDVFDGLAVPARAGGKRALFLRLPVPAGGAPGLDAVKAGLVGRGYEVDVVEITSAPLPAGADWDLIVIESPDALFAAPAQVEAMLRDPKNREVFQGRDAAVIAISRGAHRRTTAMIAAYLERAGANVVAARILDDVSPAARRLLPKTTPPASYALDAASKREAESFGASLAERSRTRLHWTLLMPRGGEGGGGA